MPAEATHISHENLDLLTHDSESSTLNISSATFQSEDLNVKFTALPPTTTPATLTRFHQTTTNSSWHKSGSTDSDNKSKTPPPKMPAQAGDNKYESPHSNPKCLSHDTKLLFPSTFSSTTSTAASSPISSTPSTPRSKPQTLQKRLKFRTPQSSSTKANSEYTSSASTSQLPDVQSDVLPKISSTSFDRKDSYSIIDINKPHLNKRLNTKKLNEILKEIHCIEEISLSKLYTATDGSKVKELISSPTASAAEFIRSPSETDISTAIKHKTIYEIWYCQSGLGILAIFDPESGRIKISELKPYSAHLIHTKYTFKWYSNPRFKPKLVVLGFTLGPWPKGEAGKEEAEPCLNSNIIKEMDALAKKALRVQCLQFEEKIFHFNPTPAPNGSQTKMLLQSEKGDLILSQILKPTKIIRYGNPNYKTSIEQIVYVNSGKGEYQVITNNGEILGEPIKLSPGVHFHIKSGKKHCYIPEENSSLMLTILFTPSYYQATLSVSTENKTTTPSPEHLQPSSVINTHVYTVFDENEENKYLNALKAVNTNSFFSPNSEHSPKAKQQLNQPATAADNTTNAAAPTPSTWASRLSLHPT